MAAAVMKLLEGFSIREMVERFGRPERTVYRWLGKGTDLLKARLEP
jgi:transposase